MVFSSNLFIFGFIPVVFSIYYVLPARLRNPFILIVSLLFYEFGAGATILALIGSIIFNYIAGQALESERTAHRRAWFWSAVVINVAVLLYYKYAAFIWQVLNDASGNWLARNEFQQPHIALPIGISFFTFQALSYIADIYTRHSTSARTLDEFGTYHSLFPQLIAGPIVRYVEIQSELRDRRLTVSTTSAGLSRFIIGLAKKVVIADNAGLVADQIFGLGTDQLSPAIAWLGALAYAVQILFDFSGYSDMAIGLGLMLGFHFPENFNTPYQSTSVTEFWRRWHMTLSRWFRDYVYVPLGGNRQGSWRTYANLVIVFFLCGLWHGAGYTFIVWGLYHGGLLIVERIGRQHFGFEPRGLLGQTWTFLAIVIGWVFFRSTTMTQAMAFLGEMTFLTGPHDSPLGVLNFLRPDAAFYLALGLLLALVPLNLSRMKPSGAVTIAAQRLATLGLFLYSILLLSTNTFNPFIYFRF
jgi:alginate O-acetyltransferase complex protein AlgI